MLLIQQMCEAAGLVHLFPLYMVTLVPTPAERQISQVIIVNQIQGTGQLLQIHS
jgi:hypothetical protein